MCPDGLDEQHQPRGQGGGPDTTYGDAADDAVLALLGHDIRAALSDVIGGLRLIDIARVDTETRLQLERMQAAGELLARLMEEGLAIMLGEAEEAHSSNMQLPRFLRDIQMRWSARARDKGLDFVLSEGADLPVVIIADRIGMERALSNLLSNAIKYTDAGRVQLSVLRDRMGNLVFEVQDDGPGFSEGALAQLFQFAGRPKGMVKPGQGMGLHIAKEMARRAGGDLTVINRPGGGAVVSLILPPSICDAVVGPSPEEGGAHLPDLRSIKVLLAEDSPTNQTLISLMLERLGAEVEIASDGVEAVNALERENFDLALIDIEMPNLSGIDVIRTLRGMGGQQGHIPVMAVTAYVLRANREAIYAAGADAILAKPLGGIEAFGAAINRVLVRNGPQPVEPFLADALSFDAPVMIEAHFDRLMEVAGPVSAPELLTRLTEDLRHVERSVILALSGPDWPELRAHTHVLIALAGAVGAKRLQHYAEALNLVAHRRELSELERHAPDMLALLDELIHFVGRAQRVGTGAP